MVATDSIESMNLALSCTVAARDIRANLDDGEGNIAIARKDSKHCVATGVDISYQKLLASQTDYGKTHTSFVC